MNGGAALRAFISLVLLVAALLILHREVDSLTWPALNAAIRRVPATRVWLAALLTLLNYAVLTCFDQLAFRHIGRRSRAGAVALTSFLAYAVANTMGFAIISGSAVRYRFYSRWGLTAEEIARLVVFYASTFWLGLLLLGGIALLVVPAPAVIAVVPVDVVRIAGATLIAAAAAYALLPFLRSAPISIGPWRFRVPSPRVVALQFILSTTDWALASAVLWVLLPDPRPPFLQTTGVFIGAQLAGLASHVPAGAGVFESLMVLLMKPTLDAALLLPALLIYRAIYYVVPFAIALATIAADASYQHRRSLARLGGRLTSLTSVMAPNAFAAAAFLAGAMLLFSGATPAIASRMSWLSPMVPVSLIEASHFAASIVGVTLLLLSRALSRRCDAAWALTNAALAVGILASLLKGADYEEAVLLAAVLAALLTARRTFDRRAAIFDEPFSTPWFAAVAAVVIASVFLGTFAFKHVEYSSALWWQFEMQGDVSRFLRASVGAGVMVLAFGLRYLLNPHPPAASPPGDDELSAAASVARTFPHAYAHLALLRDKALVWNAAGSGFAMYAVQGRTWVLLHDPVSAPCDVDVLLRLFLDRVDDYDGIPVAYEIRPDYLRHYTDLGLTVLKIGEEAVVPLRDFSLAGAQRKGLRSTLHRLEREGLGFRMLAPGEIGERTRELREVSDEWLQRKAVAEKGFSLGFFDDDYLRRCPVVVVERAGRIEAFANLWPGRSGEELSVDLARFRVTAPPSTTEGLFVHVILWAQEHGYSRFNLGMAPLAGVGAAQGPALWKTLAGYAYQHGEELYNFQGLRAFKEKFGPVWEPRYLAYPGGFALVRALADVSALIAGGYRRIFLKAA